MITENELNISNQSYTKKDFYQIYPEILDLARKLSERWDPQYSNESDPGVVLLKLLAFIADKNNYNIDKDILEVFAVSATQQESMKKICDMMGYNMQYIKSATTEISFMWNSDEGALKSDLDSIDGNYIALPKYFTNVRDSESTINYVLLEDVKLTHRYETVNAKAIEGSYVEFEINSDNVVLASNLDENNRLYLPETEIAENGIFITTVGEQDPDWTKVDNLNIQLAAQKVWKFGFDSLRQKPYIQFPDDIFTLIPNGFKVAYIRSSGINGNIPARKLSELTNNELTVYAFDGSIAQENDEDLKVSASNGNLTISNLSSTDNGSNIEDLDSAYKNFKRTVGTFETLIHCRDYANAIYKMVKDSTYDNNHLVSNIQVGDVSNDLNYSHRITTFDGYGISDKIIDDKLEQVQVYTNPSSAEPESDAKWVKGLGKFNIYLYPLNPIKAYNERQFNQSFMPNKENIYEIKNQLQSYKSLNHKVVEITGDNEAFLIKNYYDLRGKIITNRKLTNYEVIQVQQAVYTALYKNFNARELNYGEKIPYDKLVDVMMNADSRIKAINLDDPSEETFVLFARANGGTQEYKLQYNSTNTKIKNWYLKFVARNVLAGRAPLFNYDKEFEIKYNQTVDSTDSNIYGHSYEYNSTTNSYYNYAESDGATTAVDMNVTHIKTNLQIPVTYDSNTSVGRIGHTLQENEQVQLLSTRLATQITYPAYVNYFLHLEKASGASSVPAYLRSLDNLGSSSSLEFGKSADYPFYYLMYWLKRYNEAGAITDTEMDECLKKPEKALEVYKGLVDRKVPVSDLPKAYSQADWKYARRATFYKESKLASAYPGVLCSIDNHKYTKFNNTSGLGLQTKIKSLAEEPTRGQWLIWKSETSEGETTYSLFYCFEQSFDTSGIKDSVRKTIVDIYTQLGFTQTQGKALETALNTKVNDALAAELRTLGFHRLEHAAEYDEYAGYSGVWSTDWKSASGQGITQYRIDYCNYSTGIEGHSDGIPANTLYELRGGDKLYINYTDSNEVIHNLTYEWNKVTDNGIVIADGKEELMKQFGLPRMVIKVNFDIKDSDRYSVNHTYAKTSGFLSEWNKDMVGMFSLGTSDEIRIMKSSATRIESSSNWYWTAPNNRITFKKIGVTSDSATYSVILEDGEYIYYSDQAKSSLLTLGSGTELKFTTKSNAAKESDGTWKSSLTWSFEESVADKVTIDNILEDGLAAFGSINWQTCPFNGIPFSKDNYLEINILDVKTFSEGDYLENVTSSQQITSINSNNWLTIDQIKVNNENQCTNISSDTNTYSKEEPNESVLSSLSHRVRAILNIAMGPDLIQTLSSHADKTSSGKVVEVVQELSIYSSYFKDKNVPISNKNIQNYFENVDASYTEYITTKPIKTWTVGGDGTTATKYNLKSNVNIQKNGNPNGVPVHTFSISLVRKDDVKVYAINSDTPTYTAGSGSEKLTGQTLQINNFNHIYTKVYLGAANDVKLPIFVPKGQFGLMAIYYTPDENSGKGPKIQFANCTVAKMNSIDTEMITDKEIVPDENILILKIYDVNPGAYIKFINQTDTDTHKNLTDGNLLIKDLDIIKPKSATDIYGFNETYLGITSGSKDLYDVIKKLDPDGNFYWNMPIDNSNVLDVDSLDSPAAWTNKNNLLSRYMLPQLNTDSFSDIVVARSCRLNS